MESMRKLALAIESINSTACDTYTETYSCIEHDTKGNAYPTTCTRTVSGRQDEVWEERQVLVLYRILFDARDLENIGEFKGQSSVVTENEMINSETCG